MKVICINGLPRSGKDTFVSFCKEQLGVNCFNISIVDFVKEVAKQFGYDENNKTGKSRKFLSDLKDVLEEWNDIPYKKVVNSILDYAEKPEVNIQDLLVFIHAREPKDIEKFKNSFDASTLFINNFRVENNTISNHADAEVKNYTYDYIIENNSSLDDLKQKAIDFIKEIK